MIFQIAVNGWFCGVTSDFSFCSNSEHKFSSQKFHGNDEQRLIFTTKTGLLTVNSGLLTVVHNTVSGRKRHICLLIQFSIFYCLCLTTTEERWIWGSGLGLLTAVFYLTMSRINLFLLKHSKKSPTCKLFTSFYGAFYHDCSVKFFTGSM